MTTPTAKKLTRAERVEAKVRSGLSHIEAEVEVIQEDAASQIEKLREKQERENAKVDALVLEMLQRQNAELYAELARKARAKLKAESEQRSKRAAGARAAEAPTPAGLASAAQQQ